MRWLPRAKPHCRYRAPGRDSGTTSDSPRLASTARIAYREEGSKRALELVEKIVRHRRIEVIRDPDLAVVLAQLARGRRLGHRNQARHRLAGARDHHLLAGGHLAEQPREVGLRLVDIDLFHACQNKLSPGLSQLVPRVAPSERARRALLRSAPEDLEPGTSS